MIVTHDNKYILRAAKPDLRISLINILHAKLKISIILAVRGISGTMKGFGGLFCVREKLVIKVSE